MLIAAPATATPPDAVSLYDRIFGVSETHVFILRQMNDNLGLHIRGMNDTFLVAKNINTGIDDNIWPVMRMYGGYNGNDGAEVIMHFPLANAVNPYGILAAANALPISHQMRHPDNKYAPEIWLKPDVLQVVDVALPLAEIFAQMQASIDLTSAAVQAYPDSEFQSMTYHTPQELMTEIELDFEWCELDAALTVRATYEQPETHLARINCASDTVQSATLIVLIPQESQN